MTEEDAKAWVKNKANQDKVVAKFFKDFKPAKSKQAFFMAGIPGSGKTEFATNTINEIKPKLVPIEHDKLVEYIEGYSPEDYYVFRTAGSTLVSRILQECLAHGYGFIFDGTLSSPRGATNIKVVISKGYYVSVVYIVQDVLKAWNLTRDRELVKKRAIEKTGFIATCNKINANLLDIFSQFKQYENFGLWIINKNGVKTIGQATTILYSKNAIGTEGEIEKALQTSYNTDQVT